MVEYAILFLIVASLPHKPHWRHIIFSCEKKVSYFLCSNCISTSDESVQDGPLPVLCIIRKTKCFDFWERNVLFPKTKRSFFRTPKHPLPCPFPLNFSLLIITKKFGNLAKNRYICIV